MMCNKKTNEKNSENLKINKERKMGLFKKSQNRKMNKWGKNFKIDTPKFNEKNLPNGAKMAEKQMKKNGA